VEPPEGLIRFVAGPDGHIAPDVTGKLGGRGVWVSGTRFAVAEAAKRNLFAKSLKRQTKVPANLADLVEVQLAERLRQALSFAAKAGVAVFGFAKIEAALERGEIIALVEATDAAADGSTKLRRKHRAVAAASGRAAPILQLLTSDDLGLAFARSNVIHIGLSAGGQTQSVLREAERLQRYRQVVSDDRVNQHGASGHPAGHQSSGHKASAPLALDHSGSSTDNE
jgi:predicted RNA-binding protein YlxR (DUF448 family)